jgi:hypothetical protein
MKRRQDCRKGEKERRQREEENVHPSSRRNLQNIKSMMMHSNDPEIRDELPLEQKERKKPKQTKKGGINNTLPTINYHDNRVVVMGCCLGRLLLDVVARLGLSSTGSGY